MNSEGYQKELLELMKKNEEGLKELYSVYASMFPSENRFWSTIANEEQGHAQWIIEFSKKISAGSVRFARDRFKREPIEKFYFYIRKRIHEANTNNPIMQSINALSIAFDAENSLLESKYFEIFESDSAELKLLLNNLRSSTEQHIRRVREALTEERQRLGLDKIKITGGSLRKANP